MSPKATVFIVDDELAVRDSLALLVQSSAMDAECFSSVLEFLDAFEDSRPGCLVVDLRMPEMSGLELIDRLAENEISLPVILIPDAPMSS